MLQPPPMAIASINIIRMANPKKYFSPVIFTASLIVVPLLTVTGQKTVWFPYAENLRI
jgi:hypothetical protein